MGLIDERSGEMQNAINIFFIRSWWVIGVMLICAIVYERSLQDREVEYQKLRSRLLQLEDSKKSALAKQKDLKLRINSQGDLAWLELTLIKGLGLTPEDQRKVYFHIQEK